jgi:hypothetical protein
MLSITRLTRQLKLTHLSSSRLFPPTAPAITVAAANATLLSQQTCNFATGNRKVLEAKNEKRLKIQAKKKKNLSKPVSIILVFSGISGGENGNRMIRL